MSGLKRYICERIKGNMYELVGEFKGFIDMKSGEWKNVYVRNVGGVLGFVYFKEEFCIIFRDILSGGYVVDFRSYKSGGERNMVKRYKGYFNSKDDRKDYVSEDVIRFLRKGYDEYEVCNLIYLMELDLIRYEDIENYLEFRGKKRELKCKGGFLVEEED